MCLLIWGMVQIIVLMAISYIHQIWWGVVLGFVLALILTAIIGISYDKLENRVVELEKRFEK